MPFRRLLPIVLWLCAGVAAAQSPANPPAGQYVFEHGSGQLNVRPDGRFDISTIGANAHICELDGRIVRGQAKLEGGPCVVDFATRGDQVVVKSNGVDQCRESCGARATFEGTYTRPAPACIDKAVAATRKRFKQQYDARSFGAAVGTLSPVLSGCDATLDWLTKGRVRNDLALAQYRSGDKAACLATLQPLAEDAGKTDEGIREAYPPADADDYLPIVKATRTNLRLCRG